MCRGWKKWGSDSLDETESSRSVKDITWNAWSWLYAKAQWCSKKKKNLQSAAQKRSTFSTLRTSLTFHLIFCTSGAGQDWMGWAKCHGREDECWVSEQPSLLPDSKQPGRWSLAQSTWDYMLNSQWVQVWLSWQILLQAIKRTWARNYICSKIQNGIRLLWKQVCDNCRAVSLLSTSRAPPAEG